jgi:tetratricopeptide (TPR) repeat protein
MRKFIWSILFTAGFISALAQKENCEDKQYPMPALSDSIKNIYLANLVLAEKKYRNDSVNAEHIIWYGRRTAYLGNYKKAIDIYTKGISRFPVNARFYRHRGHRFITVRCFDKAIEDLKKATELIKDQIDEVEEDGIPNDRNIPTSTLQTNIWYHLGLAYSLKADYRNALLAFEKCLDISDNDDMRVATLNWLNITMRKMGKSKEADQRLNDVTKEMEIIESHDYFDILLMYKTGDDSKLIEKILSQETLSNSTLGFGLGAYYLLNGKKQKAKEIFEKVVAGNQWAGFGFIAAEAELVRMK